MKKRAPAHQMPTRVVKRAALYHPPRDGGEGGRRGRRQPVGRITRGEMRANGSSNASAGAPAAAVVSKSPTKGAKQPTRATPTHDVIFFDCDDCLYKNNWATANMITAQIERYTTEKLGLDEGRAYALYKQYGTCLRGLQEENLLREGVDEFLRYAHDVDLDRHISPDPSLREMLERIKTPKWVFTASVKAHAERCLRLLGVDDLFEGIIDVRAVDFETKHSIKAYEAAMRIAGVEDPSRCLFLDDSTSNMRAAKQVGWVNVLVGTHARDGGDLIVCEHADHIISTVHDFETLMPEHFHPDEVENAVPVEDAV